MATLTNTTTNLNRDGKPWQMLDPHVVKTRLLGLRMATPKHLEKTTRSQICSGESVKFKPLYESNKLAIVLTENFRKSCVGTAELIDHVCARGRCKWKLVSGDAPPVKRHDKVKIDHLSDFLDLVRKSKHVDKDRSSYGTFAKQTIRY